MRAFLVTGASTGIGAATATLLAQNGYRVFAGVRNDDAARAIEATSPNIRALRLDVTDEDSIAAAANAVRTSGDELAGLVNNAGISVAGPVERLPLHRWRTQFEVNLFGQIAVTQAVLALLRATKGRIAFVGSVAGRLAVPFLAPYSASKFALRAMVDSLRVELAPSGVHVSLIQPGAVRTPIWQKGRDNRNAMISEMGPGAVEGYEDAIESLVKQTYHSEKAGVEPEVVARAILDALTSPKPKAQYLVGTDARIQALLSRLPTFVSDAMLRKVMKLP